MTIEEYFNLLMNTLDREQIGEEDVDETLVIQTDQDEMCGEDWVISREEYQEYRACAAYDECMADEPDSAIERP